MKEIKLPRVQQIPHHRFPLSDWFNTQVMETVTKQLHTPRPTGRMFGPRDQEHPF